jgi:glucosamine--fructose-6-phosphate aminotransferase (isomerizing)
MTRNSEHPPAESLMLREARHAPEAVGRMLAANAELCAELGRRLREAPPPFAVSCARGSSDNAATFAKYLLEIRLGIVTASVGPSVRSVYAAAPRMKGALFLAISQSGRSPDLLTLAEGARAGGALTVALVNDQKSPLAALCEVTLPLHAGPEKSVAATKSWICSLAAILQLVACWAEDRLLLEALKRLPDDLTRAVEFDWSPAARQLADAQNLFVVGRGIGLALAQEAALKLKETCGIHAEALSAAELMHGPLTLAGPDFPVLVFSQHDEAYQSLADLIATLAARDVPVITAGPTPGGGCLALPCDPSLSPLVIPISLIQSFYPLVERVARLRGRDPDSPPHLTKVTETL